MKILVINAGSSSLKYQLIDMENEQMLCKGNPSLHCSYIATSTLGPTPPSTHSLPISSA